MSVQGWQSVKSYIYRGARATRQAAASNFATAASASAPLCTSQLNKYSRYHRTFRMRRRKRAGRYDTMMCGADSSTASVAMIVNRVKIIRHSLSTTMAANFQSREMSASSSSLRICKMFNRVYNVGFTLSFKISNYFIFT